MEVKLVSVTSPAGVDGIMSSEDMIVYCARVSSPSNQLNLDTAPRLLAFLIKNRHWSPFEMATMTVEIVTSRAIAAQILRHKSFSFQEFSQRYAESACVFEPQEARVKGTSNRQGSVPADAGTEAWWHSELERVQMEATALYKSALDNNIAPEVARMALPLGVQTRLYMMGSVRSWIHYLEARTVSHAQKEHRDVAMAIKALFAKQFPNTHAAVFPEEAI